MLSVKILDFLVNERQLTYDMVSAYCGRTRQHWHYVHKGTYSCSGDELMRLKQYVIENNVFNGKALKNNLRECSNVS
ncbi:MAG: hypothetical protein CMI54_01560 [Parcubacteria group bacterium]|nr:hypothetical protein [Parcubacteria group bacterium]|tara:strand:+ start:30581 stop:30811 length:231 start_codon:yes stop_codon:yes gene_type:complete